MTLLRCYCDYGYKLKSQRLCTAIAAAQSSGSTVKRQKKYLSSTAVAVMRCKQHQHAAT
jgi:hypothetical protein